MVTGSPAASDSPAVAQTVPSVGPYSLSSGTPGRAAAWRRGRSAGQGSPATMTASSDRRAPAGAASSTSPHSDGMLSQCETRRAATRSARRSGSALSPSSGRTSVPPWQRVQKSPATELSKARDGASRKAETGAVYPSSRARVEASSPARVTTTPLGRPVEPEV